MADIFAIAERFRADLLKRDRAAAAALTRAYGVAWNRIEQRLDVLTTKIEQARSRDKHITKSWLNEQDRLETLKRQVAEEITAFARIAEQRILDEQAANIERAIEEAEQLVRATMGEGPAGATVAWNRLPTSAVTNLVGYLQNGSPLRDLLDELGADAGQRVEDALIEGVTLGDGPRQIARRAREALSGNLVRALRICRNESLRPHREATYLSYQANRDVVKGWIWHAQLSTRTCAICWAMHGTRHSIDERFASHIVCRCAMIPETLSWAELGFPGIPDTRQNIELGTSAFDRLTAAEQHAILGPNKLKAYHAGKFTLPDLVGIKTDEKWGRSRYERSLAHLTA
jgi:SPP1 gp7 family putative phage head morphogenesis protein